MGNKLIYINKFLNLKRNPQDHKTAFLEKSVGIGKLTDQEGLSTQETDGSERLMQMMCTCRPSVMLPDVPKSQAFFLNSSFFTDLPRTVNKQ
jgi:hypothetical protein